MKNRARGSFECSKDQDRGLLLTRKPSPRRSTFLEIQELE